MKNYYRVKPIHLAAKEGDLELIKYLIDNGVSIQ